MTQLNGGPSIPAWPDDELDFSTPSKPQPPYFDKDLDAWIFSRHADIHSALRSFDLWPSSVKKGKQPRLIDKASHHKMRADTTQSLSPERLRGWRLLLAERATDAVKALPINTPIDLLASYADPLCMFLAETVTSISHEEALLLYASARIVSASAAEPYDSELSKSAKPADELLRNHFQSRPEGLRDSTFVALSQTIPCMLGNAWFSLTQFPSQWSILHQHPDLLEAGVEELMRYAGLVRTLGRYATADIQIGDVLIRRGEKIILRMIAAHRDPERYSNPNELIVERQSRGNFALGMGEHSCVGAVLIRMATTTTTAPLLTRFSSIELVDPVAWKGGSAFRSPGSLWVRLGD
ncbi:cytochrome P450 [Edaphobacter modestus]|uniref:Cytochrome P450 n=1 Tax=Edaphobacter modestus TaxID=388466 RepID=A0A4Q7YYL2_9BACT|nr:cytochrome P450 [Edaphobacter modestus]RZU42265.1 hypothetical protein BDD14_3821 [Edaphobacter modestus]